MGGAVLLSQSTYATCASDGVVKFWDHDRVREERLCPSGGAALASVGGHSVIAGHADGDVAPKRLRRDRLVRRARGGQAVLQPHRLSRRARAELPRVRHRID